MLSSISGGVLLVYRGSELYHPSFCHSQSFISRAYMTASQEDCLQRLQNSLDIAYDGSIPEHQEIAREIQEKTVAEYEVKQKRLMEEMEARNSKHICLKQPVFIPSCC